MIRFWTIAVMLTITQLTFSMPANDVCNDAILLTIGNCQTFDITDATASNNPRPNLHCGTNISPQNDIWFEITAPSSGNLTLDINQIAGGATSMAMELYSGGCSTLTPIICDGHHLELENVPSGQYYLRVITHYSSNSGMFSLCASDTGYTQYSCKIDLVVPTTQSACDPVTNTYSQDLEVYYRDDGNSVAITTAYGDFPLNGNPTTITLTNLPANSGFMSVGFQLERSPQDACFGDSYFFSYHAFMAASNCYAALVANDECSGALAIPVSSGCTENSYNNIGASHSNIYSCGFTPVGAQDVWFSIIVPPSGEVLVNTWKTSDMYPDYSVFEGSCGNLNEISCGDIFINPIISNRTPGETLYIKLMDPNAFYQDEFGLCVIDPGQIVNETCATSLLIPLTNDCDNSVVYSSSGAASDAQPSLNLSCNSNSATEDLWYHFIAPSNGALSINVTGVPIDYTFYGVYIEIFQGTCGNLNSIYCGDSTNPIPVLQNLIPGEMIFLRIVDQNMYNTVPYQICSVTPDNDICNTAIGLSVGDCFQMSNIGATASNNPTPSLSCGETLAADQDLWFTTVVPPSGNLSIQTSQVPNNNNYFFSMSIEVYSGSCLGLTPIACSHYTERASTFTQHGLVELENLTPNDVIYIRVADGGPNDGFNDTGDFEICVSDSGYTNHDCKIQYLVAGSATACDPVTNTFDQSITIYYYDDGTATQLEVLDVSYPLTPSPMTVLIQNLSANGTQRDIDLRLTSDPACQFNSYYFKNNFFDAVSNCYSGVVPNDNCSGAISLNVSAADCLTSVFDLTGANSSSPANSCYDSAIQDLWFTVEVPSNGELILKNSYASDVWTVMDVFEGTCGNLNLIGPCIAPFESFRFSGRTPGEILYIRVAGVIANSGIPSQGLFGICAVNPQMNGEVCQNATPIAVESECQNPVVFSSHYAVNEGLPSSSLSCASSTGMVPDIWFSFTVPNSGDIQIVTNYIFDNGFEMELYENVCGALNSIACYSANYGTQIISEQNRTPGEILLLQVSAPNEFSFTTFNICASSICPDMELISHPISYQVHYEDHISIEGNNVITNTADVMYDAGQYVLMSPGFEVEKNGLFHAFIDGCN